MAEDADSNFLRGQISLRAGKRMRASSKPSVLRQTRVNRPKEEPFDGKQGRNDQGGADWKKGWDTGDLSVAGTGHIDTKQKKTSPGHKAMTRGSNAGPEKQPVRRNNIDDAGTNKPDWPKGGTKVKKAKWSTNKRAGAIASNRNQYGDPPSGRKYG